MEFSKQPCPTSIGPAPAIDHINEIINARSLAVARAGPGPCASALPDSLQRTGNLQVSARGADSESQARERVVANDIDAKPRTQKRRPGDSQDRRAPREFQFPSIPIL